MLKDLYIEAHFHYFYHFHDITKVQRKDVLLQIADDRNPRYTATRSHFVSELLII